MSFSKEYAKLVRDQSNWVPLIHPLVSGGEFDYRLKKQNRCLAEYQHILDICDKNEWSTTPSVLEALHNPAIAIVITDNSEHIIWVNHGFFKMTGYTLAEIKGKNPNVLQGLNTDKTDVALFRSSLQLNKSFSGLLLNYRKNGEPYHCSIEVTPLFNFKHELVNFVAVEQEVTL